MDPRNDIGRWFDRALVARGRSISAAGAADGTRSCPYVDMADAARGGRSWCVLGVDWEAFGGRGREPPGRVGRFVRRSFR
jgi:hypothetical protein